jgi:hypothetical protein
LEDGLFFPYQVSRFLRSLPHSPELPAQTTTECRDTPTPSPQLKELVVEVNGLVEKVDEGQKGAEDGEEEDFPQFGMEEGYELDVWAEEGIGRARLRGESVWGALRGLETFSQLMWPRADGCAYALAGLPLRIRDRPALPWRGLLLDSSRHFIPVQAIRRVLDACAYAKINTYLVPALLLPPPPPDLRRLHWHLSDTQSFPLLLSAVPELARTICLLLLLLLLLSVFCACGCSRVCRARCREGRIRAGGDVQRGRGAISGAVRARSRHPRGARGAALRARPANRSLTAPTGGHAGPHPQVSASATVDGEY